MDTITILKALGNDKRLKILEYLKAPKRHFPTQPDAEKDGVCVGQIERKIGLSQSTVSQYLTQLQQADLIIAERRGQWTYYKRNEKSIQQALKLLQEL